LSRQAVPVGKSAALPAALPRALSQENPELSSAVKSDPGQLKDVEPQGFALPGSEPPGSVPSGFALKEFDPGFAPMDPV
jgi:hypothetical protein